MSPRGIPNPRPENGVTPFSEERGVTLSAYPSVEWTSPRSLQVTRFDLLGVSASGASLLLVGADDDGGIRAYPAEQCRLVRDV